MAATMPWGLIGIGFDRVDCQVDAAIPGSEHRHHQLGSSRHLQIFRLCWGLTSLAKIPLLHSFEFDLGDRDILWHACQQAHESMWENMLCWQLGKQPMHGRVGQKCFFDSSSAHPQCIFFRISGVLPPHRPLCLSHSAKPVLALSLSFFRICVWALTLLSSPCWQLPPFFKMKKHALPTVPTLIDWYLWIFQCILNKTSINQSNPHLDFRISNKLHGSALLWTCVCIPLSL